MSTIAESGEVRYRKWIVAVLVGCYLTSFVLPVMDNGPSPTRSHMSMDLHPQGMMLGGGAFRQSLALLVDFATQNAMVRGFDRPQMAYRWLSWAWLANPLFWAAVALLLWRKHLLASAAGAMATFLALNARVALTDDTIARNQEFLSGYYVWLGSMIGLTLAAVWFAARIRRDALRSLPKTAGVAVVAVAVLTVAVLGGHWSVQETFNRARLCPTPEQLAEALQSPNRHDRGAAMAQVGWAINTVQRHEDEPRWRHIADELTRAAEHEDSATRRGACQLLQSLRIYSPQVIATLRARLEDEDLNIRETAAHMLIPLGQDVEAAKQVLEAARQREWTSLLERLDSDKVNERRVALAKLEHMGPAAAPAVERLIKLLNDSDDTIREGAVKRSRRSPRPVRPRS